jgi:hypothetical protein
VERLTGLAPTRVTGALSTLNSWGLRELTQALGSPRDLDAAVAATLLVEAVERLIERGVPKTKLLSKLRDHAQLSATWAELRVAALIVESASADVQPVLEAGGRMRAQADLQLRLPSGARHYSFELKAVGLSQEEAAFSRRMAPVLDRLVPPHGFVTVHAPLDAPRPHLSEDELRHIRWEGMQAAAAFPGFPFGLSGCSVVAHGSEHSYVQRVTSRVMQALRQLPEDDAGWVGLYWSNGAPVDVVADALDWNQLPDHLAGIGFFGSVVVFPAPIIHNFQLLISRGSTSKHSWHIHSDVGADLAQRVMTRAERSAGVRPTLLRATVQGRHNQLLRRDGTQHLLPYNLILDSDPEEFSRRSKIGGQ